MDPSKRITAEDASEHPYFNALKPKQVKSRVASPIFDPIEKHRALSSTHRGQYPKYSNNTKENCNPVNHTAYGKFNRGRQGANY